MRLRDMEKLVADLDVVRTWSVQSCGFIARVLVLPIKQHMKACHRRLISMQVLNRVSNTALENQGFNIPVKVRNLK